MDNYIPSLNRSLKTFRVFNNLTQSVLADKLDVSKSFVSEIESGKRNATIKIVNKYAEVFSIPPSEILALSELYDGEYKSGRSNLFTKVINWIREDFYF